MREVQAYLCIRGLEHCPRLSTLTMRLGRPRGPKLPLHGHGGATTKTEHEDVFCISNHPKWSLSGKGGDNAKTTKSLPRNSYPKWPLIGKGCDSVKTTKRFA